MLGRRCRPLLLASTTPSSLCQALFTTLGRVTTSPSSSTHRTGPTLNLCPLPAFFAAPLHCDSESAEPITRLIGRTANVCASSHGHLRRLLPFLLLRRSVDSNLWHWSLLTNHLQAAQETAYMTQCWQTANGKLSPTCWASSRTYCFPPPLRSHPAC